MKQRIFSHFQDYLYNIGADGKHVVLNKLYDISFALIGIQFYNIDTASKTIVE
jgi:hypothetical protein